VGGAAASGDASDKEMHLGGMRADWLSGVGAAAVEPAAAAGHRRPDGRSSSCASRGAKQEGPGSGRRAAPGSGRLLRAAPGCISTKKRADKGAG
jgi:hypothetical protein